MKIENTKDITIKNVSLLIYGRSGIGKTRWLATAENPLVIDFERGLLSLSDDSVPYVRVTSFDQFRKMFGDLRKHVTEKKCTLCIDSLTELSDMAMEQIKKDIGNGAAKDARKTYPVLFDQTTAVIRALQALPCDVVFTAKHDVMEGGVNVPRVQGSRLRSELCHAFDTIIYLNGDEDNGVIGTTAINDTCEAKDRSGKLEVHLDVTNGSLARVISQMKGEEDVD